MPARLSSIACLLSESRLTVDSIAAGVLARLALGTLAGLALSASAANSAMASDDPTWLTRDIPPVMEDLLKGEADMQGLFSPRLKPDARLPMPGGMGQSAVSKRLPDGVATDLLVPRQTGLPGSVSGQLPADASNEQPTRQTTDFAADLPADLPGFSESLLRQAPAELGRIAAPANERKSVPEPMFLNEMWTFSTPVDRITPLKNELSANGRFVHDLPSALKRFDHLTAEDLPTDHWVESARLQRLPPEALYAVALQESGMRTASGAVQPWPWTLNCNAPCPHGAMRFANRQAATQALARLLKAGWRNIDIGAMQINYRAHAKRFSQYDLLDPRINVIVGGVILREAVQQARGSLKGGYALYHVGVLQSDNASRAEQYASSVSRWTDRVRHGGALRLASR